MYTFCGLEIHWCIFAATINFKVGILWWLLLHVSFIKIVQEAHDMVFVSGIEWSWRREDGISDIKPFPGRPAVTSTFDLKSNQVISRGQRIFPVSFIKKLFMGYCGYKVCLHEQTNGRKGQTKNIMLRRHSSKNSVCFLTNSRVYMVNFSSFITSHLVSMLSIALVLHLIQASTHSQERNEQQLLQNITTTLFIQISQRKKNIQQDAIRKTRTKS